MTAIAEPARVRPWPSPRCHGCRELISDNGQMTTLDLRDNTTGKLGTFLFPFCGNCGTAFAIERVRDPLTSAERQIGARDRHFPRYDWPACEPSELERSDDG